MRRLLPLIAALGLSTSAHGYTLYRADDAGGPPLRWFTTEAVITFDTNEPQEIQQSVAHDVTIGAFRVWSNHSCEATLTDYHFESAGFVPGRKVGYVDERQNENLVVWVGSAAEWIHGKGVVALTSLTFDTRSGEVVDADLEFNDAEFRFSASPNGPAQDEMDLENAVAHEAGHFLGLDHSNSKLATMYKNAQPGEVIKRDPHQDDVDGFCALYGPSAIPKVTDDGAYERSRSGCAPASIAGTPSDRPGLWLLLLGLLVAYWRFRRASPAR